MLRQRPARSNALFGGNPLPGGHGLDDLRVEDQGDPKLLAFLHIAEKTAAGRFAIYKDCVDDDPKTRAIFEEILRDEVFHMNYSYQQLGRVSPESQRRHVWRARASRLWNRYLRVAAMLAGLIGDTIMTIMYFVLLPPFAWTAKRVERREAPGWQQLRRDRAESPTSMY